MMNSTEYVTRLSSTSLSDVFNPYRDTCGEHDHSRSAAIRCLNLQRYLDAVLVDGIDGLWLGRDCGYRGGRRTGIALTDELQLPTLERHFKFDGINKATVGLAVKERTATHVWKIIHEVNAKVFLWNVFPYHPFKPGNSMSNRRHTTREFDQCKELLLSLIDWLQPKVIISLGSDAHREVERIGLKSLLVRHPSYGGHIEFAATIRNLYARPK